MSYRAELLPMVEPIEPPPDLSDVLRCMQDVPHVLLLDSALKHPGVGRYSFLAADPFEYLEVQETSADCLARVERQIARFRADTLPGYPPFQGGAAGLFGYDLCRSLEPVPPAAVDEFRVPPLAVGLYDTVLAIDHLADRAWIISQGFPETDAASQRERARARIEQFKSWMTCPGNGDPRRTPWFATDHHVPASDLAAQYPIGSLDALTSNFSARLYQDTVQKAIDYIHAGDVFQVNLAQRLLFPAADSSIELYLRLRERNPAPFAGYFDLGRYQIVSASPERFVRVADRLVETRPIKGTRQRSPLPEADLFTGDELQQSEKDRAENVMIVDLLRNDLSRVCEPDSVRVAQLCTLEVYQFVQHLVSVVNARLRPDRTPLDLLRAAFPGGSITGAPKVRAMQIIAELEPTARGPYCGSLGYIGFDGTTDLSILIRTITAGGGWWQMPVGGGIVAQSQPRAEYEETWHKARGLLRALV